MLVIASSLEEYFREILIDALKGTQVQLTEEAKTYLIQLLDGFSRSEVAFAMSSQGETPALASLLGQAQEAAPDKALKMFRHLGDSSLYVAGFFKESETLSRVGAPYYISMGESAYFSASNLLRSKAAGMAALYHELADCFDNVVAVFNAMSLKIEKEKSGKPQGLMALLARYERTKDPNLLALLIESGLFGKKGMKGYGDLH